MMYRTMRLILAGCAVLVLAACSQKAETLKLAASQFEAESRATITLLEELRVSEIAPAATTESARTRGFVENVLNLDSSTPVTPNILKILRNPDDVDTAGADAAWADLLAKLNSQYRAFARTFDSLDQASFTARNIVRKAEPIAARLVSQIVHFSNTTTANPPQFLNQRGALLFELQQIRTARVQDTEKRAALGSWLDKWRDLEAREADLLRRITEQSAKASSVGLAVMKQIRTYDQLSAADIADAMGIAFSAAGELTGRDLSALQGRTAAVLADIESDPVWKSIMQQTLDEVNATRSDAKPAS